MFSNLMKASGKNSVNLSDDVLRLKINTPDFCFEYETKDKLTIVDDDSGTGKTRIYDILKQMSGNKKVVEVSHEVLFPDTPKNILDATGICLVLIDDFSQMFAYNYNELQDIINNSKHYFIVFSRTKVLERVPYSVDCIKIMKYSHSHITLVNRYNLLYLYNKSTKVNRCFIEDSTTGLLFFKRVFNNIDVKSVYGKDKFIFNNDYKEGDLIIFDRCGFGSSMRVFLEVIDVNQCNILDYESFEEMLLSLLKDIEIPILCDNIEKFYESELIKELPQYGKSLNCQCFSKCVNCSICSLKGEFYNCKSLFKKSKYSNYVEV